MLLNFASDKVFAYKNQEIIFLDRKKLETDLAYFLKENLTENIYVISGPGYFSSVRIGIETINIIKTLGYYKNIYFFNKMEFFSKIGIDNIYLFSGNKNKFIHLKNNQIKIINKNNLDFNIYFEQLFEQKLENINIIEYTNILKNYKNLDWNKLGEKELLKAYYIFQPIVC